MNNFGNNFGNNFNGFNFYSGIDKNMGSFLAKDAILKMKIQTLKNIRDSITAQLKQLEAEREKLSASFQGNGAADSDGFWRAADSSTNGYQYKDDKDSRHSNSGKQKSNWGNPFSSNRYSKDMDPYIILKVDRDATYDEVTRAYRAAANKAHPDKGGNDMEMAKINAAYEALKMMNGWK